MTDEQIEKEIEAQTAEMRLEQEKDLRRSKRYRRALIGWIIVFTIVVGWQVNRSLNSTEQNRNRIADIQDSRVTSCKQTYQSFRVVFKPFFRPAKKRTAQENKNIKKFNSIINAKIAGCSKQAAILLPKKEAHK